MNLNLIQLRLSQIGTIRGRLIFSIAIAAMYQSLFKKSVFSVDMYVYVFLFTLIAIWMPRRFRGAMYYICVAVGGIGFGVWEWTVAPLHTIPVDSLLPIIVILAAAPTPFLTLSLSLTAGIVLLSLAGGTYPASLWGAVGQIGIYMGVRSVRARREMEATRRRYVAELESTLSELRSAQAKLETDAAHSIHYAAQAERFRIARDIHDGLGHHLTSLIVQLQALSYMIPDSLVDVRERVPKLLEVARAGLAEVRKSVREWEDPDDSFGLAALHAVVEEFRSTTDCTVNFESVISRHQEWPTNVSVVLYRVLQETLANAVRHSNADHIDVRLVEEGERVRMSVSDNGWSASEVELKPGFGLRNMKSRCQEIGGSCTWMVRPDGGVSVEVLLPTALDEDDTVVKMEERTDG